MTWGFGGVGMLAGPTPHPVTAMSATDVAIRRARRGINTADRGKPSTPRRRGSSRFRNGSRSSSKARRYIGPSQAVRRFRRRTGLVPGRHCRLLELEPLWWSSEPSLRSSW